MSQKLMVNRSSRTTRKLLTAGHEVPGLQADSHLERQTLGSCLLSNWPASLPPRLLLASTGNAEERAPTR